MIYAAGLQAMFGDGDEAAVKGIQKQAAQDERTKRALANRTSAESSSVPTRSGKKSVKLNDDERDAARMAGISDEEYALFKGDDTVTMAKEVRRRHLSKKRGKK